MAGYGIRLVATDGALREVARRAAAEGTGARGLVTILEGTLRPFKFELPCTDVHELVLDEAAVRDPARRLQEILCDFAPRREAALRRDVHSFSHRHKATIGVDVTFSSEAADMIVQRALESRRSVRDLCSSLIDPQALALNSAGGGDAVEVLHVTADVLRERGWLDR